MKSQTHVVAALLCTLCTGCGVFTSNRAEATVDAAPVPAAPAGETAAPPQPTEPAEGTEQATWPLLFSDDVELAAETDLPAGRYRGDLVIDRTRTVLTGAGADHTIIDGDLYVASQCRVQGLTVTGNIVFTGNAAITTVVCRGEVLDYGTGNRF